MAKKKGPPLGTFLKRFSMHSARSIWHRCAGRPDIFAPNVAAVTDIGCPTGDISVSNAAVKSR